MHIPNGIQRIRGKTSTNGNTPAEKEGGKEGALERANKDHGLEGVVDTEAREITALASPIRILTACRKLTRDHGRR